MTVVTRVDAQTVRKLPTLRAEDVMPDSHLMSANDTPFKNATAKITIGTYKKDADIDPVEAQYNPKEIQLDQTVPWNKPTSTNKTSNDAKGDGSIRLEFGGAEGRSMSLDLLFDAYETKDKSVEKALANLALMASVKSPGGSEGEGDNRPPLLVVVWGLLFNETKKFTGVIENLSIKYQMFASDGTPLRATATVKFKEANSLAIQEASRGS
jgi:hypothetical protein